MRERPSPAVSTYTLAVVATAAAVAIRWFVDPWLHAHLALVSIFPAVGAAVWYGGWRTALLSAILG
jgi:hypothetical protein